MGKGKGVRWWQPSGARGKGGLGRFPRSGWEGAPRLHGTDIPLAAVGLREVVYVAGAHPVLPALDHCGCRADCERGAAVGSAPGTGLGAQRLGVRRGCWPRAIATTRGGTKACSSL